MFAKLNAYFDALGGQAQTMFADYVATGLCMLLYFWKHIMFFYENIKKNFKNYLHYHIKNVIMFVNLLFFVAVNGRRRIKNGFFKLVFFVYISAGGFNSVQLIKKYNV